MQAGVDTGTAVDDRSFKADAKVDLDEQLFRESRNEQSTGNTCFDDPEPCTSATWS